MGKARELWARAVRGADSAPRWGGLIGVVGVLLLLEALATTGFVRGVMEPASAGGTGSYFAEGDIHGANPASGDVFGITETEFVNSCRYPPESQGLDGYVFQLPEEFAVPAPFTVTGVSEAPLYDLDVYLYDEACDFLESVATENPDEEGTLPAETRYVVVSQFLGAETHVTLCAGDPKGCVATSSGSSSSSTTTTTSSPPDEGEMSTTLKASRDVARYEQPFTLSGKVSGDEECGPPGDHRVGLTKRILGNETGKSVDRGIPVADDGTWSIEHRSTKSAEYIARVSPSENCESSASDPVIVHVRVNVDITQAPKDCDDNVAGRVRPNHEGTSVVLQRHENKKFRPTGEEDTLDEDSKFSLRVERCGLYRVVWPGQAESNKWGASKFEAKN